MPQRTVLQTESGPVDATSLDEVIYPVAGFRKGELLNYYVKISEHLVPHLRCSTKKASSPTHSTMQRPTSVRRCSDRATRPAMAARQGTLHRRNLAVAREPARIAAGLLERGTGKRFQPFKIRASIRKRRVVGFSRRCEIGNRLESEA
jgi:hypothetical protein